MAISKRKENMTIEEDEAINFVTAPYMLETVKNMSFIPIEIDHEEVKKEVNKIFERLNSPYLIGCYTHINNEEYHSLKDYISRSAIMDYARSPYTYWAKHLNPNRPKIEPTPAMIFGTAFHTLMLEPDLFDKKYIVKKPPVLLKEVGKKAYEEYKKYVSEFEDAGKTLLSSEDGERLWAMQAVFNRNTQAKGLSEGAQYETSYFWQDRDSGLMLKARPDILHENMIIDLKTCSDASPRAFQNSMVANGYHVQGAMIRDGVEAIQGRRIDNVINICIETKYPFNMAIYVIENGAIDEGERKYKDILLALKTDINDNDFSDYGVQQIGLPKWAI